MKIGIIGGGSWGTTLAQVLVDNKHKTLIYEINKDHLEKIKKHRHPFFDLTIPEDIKVTDKLNEVANYSDIILIALPSKAIRQVLVEINKLIVTKKSFINVSKGIEPDTFLRVSQIVEQTIDKDKLADYATLTGPSHSEEVILRKLTLLTAASNNIKFSQKVQQLFSNEEYLRVYSTTDVIGAEVGGAAKNAIAIISGIVSGLNMGENARAALISRGVFEIVRLVEKMGGLRETAFGLTGIGDLIVTCSSTNSRNFQAGKKIGEGMSLDTIYKEEKQTIEGLRSIEAFYKYSVVNKIEIPIIQTAYKVIYENLDFYEAISMLLKRKLTKESI